MGLVHFIALDAETDIPNSPEKPFSADLTGNETLAQLQANQTGVTNAGPFGESGNTPTQLQWLAQDLAAVNRTKTPW